ncbi:uncharacterized protein conserved in bacteria [Serpentinimonas raichei]|uniref:Uncharacterized protein conserved in bacteria n=1 Tax=Serpentinimonas raichei TaxID=1458425 RepID=A0A060NM70_9BURK|nr:uncharacterized protein conserved in bacteria [Serpentinimonas raichei]
MVMSQAAATSFIHRLMLAVSQVIHSKAKGRCCNGAKAAKPKGGGALGAVESGIGGIVAALASTCPERRQFSPGKAPCHRPAMRYS